MFMSPFVAEQGGPPVGPASWYTGPWPAPYDAVTPIQSAYVIAAYQPRWATGSIYARQDAASYANSLLNIANPGTHDTVTGIAPTWGATFGWLSTGLAYLTTDIVAGSAGQNHSIFGNGLTGVWGFMAGVRNAPVPTDNYTALKMDITSPNVSMYNCGAKCNSSYAVGSIGFAGLRAYKNGVDVGGIAAMPNVETLPQYILAVNTATGVAERANIRLLALVYYSTVITPAQAAAVSWAMEVIRNA